MDPQANSQIAEMAFSQTFSLRMDQLAKISDLSRRLGKSKSEIVRRAIDLLYETEDGKEAPNGDQS